MSGQPAGLPRLYFIAQGLHFAAGGLMSVLFPWIIAQQLHETQARVGLSQFLATLPLMLLILLAGAVADGRDLRGYVARLQLTAAIPAIALAIVIATGNLSFYSATICLVALNIVAAFIMPARDALLSHITPPEIGLSRTAAMAVAATFGGQLIGTTLAASASTIGAVPLLALQAILLALSGILSSRVPLISEDAFKDSTPTRVARLLHEMRDGVMTVVRSERLRTMILYLVLPGPLFNGMFLVGFPLMVRDVFHGDAPMLSIIISVFLVGLTASSFTMARLPVIEHQGRAMMLLSLNNVFVFTVVYLIHSFPVFVVLMFLWGLSAGASMAVNRGMVQAAAPPMYRARVLSVLQFSQVAGGPIGALLYGFMAQWVGIENALLMVPVATLILWITFRLTTNLWHFKREDAIAATTAPIALD
ncbi:MAG: MFS transporter [Alphaproteobacteria bacterium]|nr:MFS transporter [Alphaproteobacteria bacterium]